MNRIYLDLFGNVCSSPPNSSERVVASKADPAVLCGKAFALEHGGNDFILGGATLDHSLPSVRMNQY